MKVKVTFEIEIDETEYAALTKKEIQQLAKEVVIEDQDAMYEIEKALNNKLSKANKENFDKVKTTNELELIDTGNYSPWKADFFFKYQGHDYAVYFSRVRDVIELEGFRVYSQDIKLNKEIETKLKTLVFKSDFFKEWLTETNW